MKKNKWTYETCYEVAKDCHSRGEFQKKDKGAYCVAWRNGWLNDYVWLENRRNKWTYEKCYNIAKDCHSRWDFGKKNSGAYDAARRNGWLDDYTWFEGLRHDNWTRETCYEIAKDCHSRSDFEKKNSNAYHAALRNGWLDDYTWFEGIHEPWTYETCYEAAKNYHSRGEFSQKNNGAYNVARINKWLDDYTWFKRRKDPFTNKMDNVYAYFFKLCNAVYVGRTINLNKRNREHNKENSSVFKFAAQHNIPIPEMTILERGLSLEDGLVKEDYFCNKFKEEGWKLINKAKTGIGSGSLGGVAKKWTYNRCYEAAKDCHSRNDFRKKNISAYSAARINGWLNDYTWFEKKNHDKWTYETCYEAAKDCHSRKEFEKKNSGAYNVARINKWLDDYTWFKAVMEHHEPWTYEECYNIAKDCHNRWGFAQKNRSACQAARKNGWLDDYTWFEGKHEPWTYETCHEAAKECHSRSEFANKNSGAYSAARINGWLDEFFKKVS